jgi:DNA-binding IclR family transcriptional regulator
MPIRDDDRYRADNDELVVGPVARTARLLAAIADCDEPVGIARLAELTSLPASTVHRLLKLLGDEGMVDRNPNTHNYGVGPELYRIAARVVDSVDIVLVVQPYLQGLVEAYDETVLFGQYAPANRSMSFVARADGSSMLQYRIRLNSPISLIWGASGKAILAFLDYEAVSEILEFERSQVGNGRAPGSQAPLPERHELERSLEVVRRTGYAVSEGEKLPQARGIGAPVYGPRGVVGSLTLTSPKDRLPHGEIQLIAHDLKEVAQQISVGLGASPTYSEGAASTIKERTEQE